MWPPRSRRTPGTLLVGVAGLCAVIGVMGPGGSSGADSVSAAGVPKLGPDDLAPRHTRLIVRTPGNGATVHSGVVRLTGMAEPGAMVTVGEKRAAVGHDGSWLVHSRIAIGEALLTVSASKPGLEPATMTVDVTRKRSAAEVRALRVREHDAAEARLRAADAVVPKAR